MNCVSGSVMTRPVCRVLERYRAELTASGALDELRAVLKEHPIATLLFAAHDEEHNNAVVLQHLLETE